MNPMLQEALGSIIRSGLMIFAGYLVTSGIWTPEAATTYVAGATVAILTLAWSVWQKYKSRIKLVTALASNQSMSEEKLEARIANVGAASVTTDKSAIPQ